MKWIKIPDELMVEANGFAWQETLEKNDETKTKDFHLRYNYSVTRKNLCVDVIEDLPDGTSKIILMTGIYEEPQNMHLAVAAIERIFPESQMVREKEFSKLSELLALYRGSYNKLPEEYFNRYKEDLTDSFAALYAVYKYAQKHKDDGSSVSEKFKNVVEVDFKSGKKADKPDIDLVKKVRGAIKTANDNDSPLKHTFGLLKPQSKDI